MLMVPRICPFLSLLLEHVGLLTRPLLPTVCARSGIPGTLAGCPSKWLNTSQRRLWIGKALDFIRLCCDCHFSFLTLASHPSSEK